MTSPSSEDGELDFDLIVLEIEGKRTRVPRAIFKGSAVFGDMFSLPQAVGAPVDGSDEGHPLKIEGVSRADFRHFVKAANAHYFSDCLPKLTWAQAGSVLKLAALWDMQDLRTAVVAELTPTPGQSDAVEVLRVALEHTIAHWIPNAMEQLVCRDRPLSAQEAELLGFDMATRVWTLREQNRHELVDAVRRAAHKELYHAWQSDCSCAACVHSKAVTGKKVDGLIHQAEVPSIAYGAIVPKVRKDIQCLVKDISSLGAHPDQGAERTGKDSKSA